MKHKKIFMLIIFLCLGVIGCKETNEPNIGEPDFITINSADNKWRLEMEPVKEYEDDPFGPIRIV
jgi:hypothetical protein